MQHDAQGLAEEVRVELEESYQRHGCGPEFWNTYQRVLARLVPDGSQRTQVTNEVALLIEELGIVQRAQLVEQPLPRSRC